VILPHLVFPAGTNTLACYFKNLNYRCKEFYNIGARMGKSHSIIWRVNDTLNKDFKTNGSFTPESDLTLG
jgi:hypothetical protein